MNILAALRERFTAALQPLTCPVDPWLDMIHPAQDPRFGDYQANLAMPLAKQLGQPPRDVAAQVVERLQVADLCETPEVAGPGFINLRLRNPWLAEQLGRAVTDPRLGVPQVTEPRTFVVDYSSPNVAKAMHVGHIRSTVIGDAICRTLRFLGHRVISDNHLGDWGTQFGMIIYGYKHFVEPQRYEAHPVQELGRLYKLVHQLVEYRGALRELPDRERRLAEREQELAGAEAQPASGPKDKQREKLLRDLRGQVSEARAACEELRNKIAAIENNGPLLALAQQHPQIEQAVLDETARLHAGDPENRRLWGQFLPQCKQDIQRIYDRIGVGFDQELGESFYQDQLESVVQEFQQRGLATESNGAVCVFFDEFDTPMIIRKKDGAFLYATTDLATLEYRAKTWNPDVVLYVVDHRQGEHFAKLFAAFRRWTDHTMELRHISFGTVLGEDGRPYRTRSGDVVGLEGLLDEAIRRAYRVVAENDDAKPNGPELSEPRRQAIAQAVGHAALKYADLSHNRTSDYVFSYDKMVALEGNTATYMQYSYARVRGIFERGCVDVETLRTAGHPILITEEAERDLAVELVRWPDAVAKMLEDYRPNIFTGYLFSLATKFSRFYQQCDVLKADTEAVRNSRLLLCDLTARTVRLGLSLLGIEVVDQM